MTMNSAITNLYWQCGKVTHTDKMLADQCRLMTAMPGQMWGRVDRDNSSNNDEKKTREERGTTDADAQRVEVCGGNHMGEKDDPFQHEYSTTHTNQRETKRGYNQECFQRRGSK